MKQNIIVMHRNYPSLPKWDLLTKTFMFKVLRESPLMLRSMSFCAKKGTNDGNESVSWMCWECYKLPTISQMRQLYSDKKIFLFSSRKSDPLWSVRIWTKLHYFFNYVNFLRQFHIKIQTINPSKIPKVSSGIIFISRIWRISGAY